MRSILTVSIALLAGSVVYGAEGRKGKTPPPVSAQEKAEGFVSLFDGKTLKGWTGSVKGYTAEKGLLVCQEKGGGNLFTDRDFADFVLRLQYRLQPGGNNGVAIRTPAGGHPASDGIEIQILDDPHPRYAKIYPEQHTGSIYGAVAAKVGFARPAGQWNEMEITAQGSHITVKLNGTVITDADTAGLGTVNFHNRVFKGMESPKGRIGFAGHGARVEFRNIRIKEL